MPIAAILALLPQLISGGISVFDYIRSLQATAAQSAEYTPELEAQFDALLAQEAAAPENLPHRPSHD